MARGRHKAKRAGRPCDGNRGPRPMRSARPPRGERCQAHPTHLALGFIHCLDGLYGRQTAQDVRVIPVTPLQRFDAPGEGHQFDLDGTLPPEQ